MVLRFLPVLVTAAVVAGSCRAEGPAQTAVCKPHSAAFFEIKSAAAGVAAPSESAARAVDVFEWGSTAQMDELTVLQLGEEDPRADVERVSTSDLLIRLQSGRDAAPLRAALTKLRDVRAFRVGQIEVNYYVVGRAPGGTWVGVIISATET